MAQTPTDPACSRPRIHACTEPCPIERGMRILGGKWKGSILWHLRDGPVRFNDLARQLGGASRKMVPCGKVRGRMVGDGDEGEGEEAEKEKEAEGGKAKGGAL